MSPPTLPTELHLHIISIRLAEDFEDIVDRLAKYPNMFPKAHKLAVHHKTNDYIAQVKSLTSVSQATHDYICGTIISANIATLTSLQAQFEAEVARIKEATGATLEGDLVMGMTGATNRKAKMTRRFIKHLKRAQ